MYYVYELVDPRTNVPGYVGITNNPKNRRMGHLSLEEGNVEKNSWILRLRKAGVKPVMKILETVPDKRVALQRERYWINFYSGTGVNLTNIAGSDVRHQFFKRLDDEWEKYQRESAESWRGSTREGFINEIQWFTGFIKPRFPSKKSIIPLWEEQKIREYERHHPENKDISTEN